MAVQPHHNFDLLEPLLVGGGEKCCKRRGRKRHSDTSLPSTEM
jgi:hypothetical protein